MFQLSHRVCVTVFATATAINDFCLQIETICCGADPLKVCLSARLSENDLFWIVGKFLKNMNCITITLDVRICKACVILILSPIWLSPQFWFHTCWWYIETNRRPLMSLVAFDSVTSGLTSLYNHYWQNIYTENLMIGSPIMNHICHGECKE